jgi:hypothetical protein
LVGIGFNALFHDLNEFFLGGGHAFSLSI